MLPLISICLWRRSITNEWYYDNYGLCTWVYRSLIPPGVIWCKLNFVGYFFEIELGIKDVDTTPVNASEDLPEIEFHSRELIEDMDWRMYEDFHFERWT